MTALFLIIAAGYLVGEVNVKGFALGSGGTVRRPGLRCVCAEGRASRNGRHARACCSSSIAWASSTEGVVSRAQEPLGPEGQLRGLCGLAASAAVSLVIDADGAANRPRRSGCSRAPQRYTQRSRRFSTRSGIRTRRSATASRTRSASPARSSACTCTSPCSSRRSTPRRTGIQPVEGRCRTRR